MESERISIFNWFHFPPKTKIFNFSFFCEMKCRVFYLFYIVTCTFDNHTEIFSSINDSCMSSCFHILSEPEQERFFFRFLFCRFLFFFFHTYFFVCENLGRRPGGLTFIDLIIQALIWIASAWDTRFILVWDSISYIR